MKPTRQFAPLEPCAINPQAFGGLFSEAPSTWSVEDGIATLTINGPLGHHSSFWEQSYEDLVANAAAIMAERPRLVVLSIDSPGGVCSGCFDTVRRLRAIFGSTRVVAFVTGAAASAAYALACVADEIVVSETSLVGSVGVIDAIVDATGANAQAGLRFHLFKSGARKADGIPHAELAPEGAAARQLIVDRLAARFFELVAERRGLDPEAVRALEAGLFIGADAIGVGLADRVEHYVDFLARIASGKGASSPRTSRPLDAPSARARSSGAPVAASRSPVPATLQRSNPPKVPIMSASARPSASRPVAPSRPPRTPPPAPAATAKLARSALAPQVDAKRLEQRRQLARQMGVGGVAHVVRDTGDRLELGVVVHESALAGQSKGPTPREAALECQLREALFASRPDLSAEQRAGLDKLDTDSLRVILEPTASNAPKPKRARPVDAKRRAEMRELDRQMGVGLVAHAIRDAGNRLELGAIVHESELDGVDVRRVGQPMRQDAKGPAATAKLTPADAKRLEAKRELDRQMGVGFVAHVVRDTGDRIELGAVVHESAIDGADVRRAGQPKGRTPREMKLEAQLREVLFASRPDLGPAQRARLDELDTDSLRVALVATPSKARRPARSESSRVQASIDKKTGRNLVTVVRDQGNRLELGAVVHRSEVGPGDLEVDKLLAMPKARAAEVVKAVGAAVILGRLEGEG